jgi:5-methyltetrahydropteroyltriglutamate--homocysteine methyltransferase
MKTSQAKILTTHVGSLPRSQTVVDALFAEDAHGVAPKDQAAYDAIMTQAVMDVVAQQKATGVDIPSDGEVSKISYATYIRHRLTGFEIKDYPRSPPSDLNDFPAFKDRLSKMGGTPTYHRPVCCAPIEVKDLSGLHKDIANLKAAAAAAGYEEAFMNAASPGVVALFQPNQFYTSDEAYIEALANAMSAEFEAIVNAGLLLQVDAPDLALGRHMKYADLSDEAFLAKAQLQVEALNHALRNVPADRVRMHLCWGNYEGPHHHDIPLKKILNVVMKAKPQALLFEASNPRHAHEWAVWKDAGIPADKILVPGVIDSVTNFIEHPELIAQRITNFTNVVGRERVMAGTDCGFGTFAGYGAVHPDIAYAKLRSLTQGAELASRALWAK